MLARLRENLLYKLLALAFAVALHLYVTGQQNPPQSRTLSVPLRVQNQPPDLLIDERAAPPSQVSITLDGPADAVSRLVALGVSASIDLSQAHAGRNIPVPVNVELPVSLPGEGIGIETMPRTVAVVLTPKIKQRLPVTANVPGTPPVGYTFRAPVVTPRTATIVGAQDAVRSVVHLVVKAEMSGMVGTVDDDFPIVALDAQGSQVSDVTVIPATAHVRIAMVREPAMKTLFVSPEVTGAPPFPYRIAGYDVTPPTVVVAGRPEALARASTVMTTPVDVTGATSDVTREVACLAPHGLSLHGTRTVRVTVHIVTAQPMVAPPAAGTGPQGPPGAP